MNFERTAYEYDMCQRIISLQFDKAVFESRPSVMLGLKPVQDGNAFLVVMGDLPTGIVGSGDTPDLAMADFDKNWYAKIPAKESADD